MMPLMQMYYIKIDKTKKVRCICNRYLKQNSSVIFRCTYAAVLEQSSSRMFQVLSALNIFIIEGAKVINLYAKALAPESTLYMKVHNSYYEWYQDKLNINIPLGWVLPVHHALQGHPESVHLQSDYIHFILTTKLSFTSSPIKPCFYLDEY